MKTDIFNELIETGNLPVRPGVIRLISAWLVETLMSHLLNNCLNS